MKLCLLCAIKIIIILFVVDVCTKNSPELLEFVQELTNNDVKWTLSDSLAREIISEINHNCVPHSFPKNLNLVISSELEKETIVKILGSLAVGAGLVIKASMVDRQASLILNGVYRQIREKDGWIWFQKIRMMSNCAMHEFIPEKFSQCEKKGRIGNKCQYDAAKRWMGYLFQWNEYKYVPKADSSSKMISELVSNELVNWKERSIPKNYITELFQTRLEYEKSRTRTAIIQIISNQLYVVMHADAPKDPHVKMCLENLLPFLLNLLKHFKLPNTEFVINFLASDWWFDTQEAVFSYCKHTNSKHILVPRYYYNHHGKWEEGSNFRLDSYDIPWRKKKPMSVFRGSFTHWKRQHVVDLGANHTDIMNHGITKYIPVHLLEHEYELNKYSSSFITSPSIEAKNQLYFKYLLHVEGAGCADRLWTELLSDSVVLFLESDQKEFWYPLLKDEEHYVHVKSVSKLKEKIEWAINNDSKMKTIAKNGRKFAQKVLQHEVLYQYFHQLLLQWSKRLNYKVQLRTNAVLFSH